jgi:hypothetical protein
VAVELVVVVGPVLGQQVRLGAEPMLWLASQGVVLVVEVLLRQQQVLVAWVEVVGPAQRVGCAQGQRHSRRLRRTRHLKSHRDLR